MTTMNRAAPALKLIKYLWALNYSMAETGRGCPDFVDKRQVARTLAQIFILVRFTTIRCDLVKLAGSSNLD